MVFSSIEFIFLFLPLCLATWFALIFLGRCFHWARNGLTAGNTFLLLASLAFYVYGEQWLVFVLLASVTLDYVCARAIAWSRSRLSGAPRRRAARAALVASLCGNLGLLAYFKYLNFGVANVRVLLQSLGADTAGLDSIATVALPLGISFYTFQSMSYTIDVYRGEVQASRRYLDFACYVLLFPQLVAGPIVRYRHIEQELRSRRLSMTLVASGMGRFMAGLAKKVLVANVLAVPADRVFAMPLDQLGFVNAWIGAVAYGLQIYFDFSGYSDMAIGLGRMFGFTFHENFRHPYWATGLRDFWRRWHISLSTWFRDYVYIPLGGSRRGGRRVAANLLIVFLLCGLWHGAEWTFVLWGLYHGCFLVAERHRAVGGFLERHAASARFYAFTVVTGGWVLFRATSLFQAYVMARSMAGLGPQGLGLPSAGLLDPVELTTLAIGFVGATPLIGVLCARVLAAQGDHPTVACSLRAAGYLALAMLALLSVSSLAAGTHNPFIYFRF